jgi:hypothetical protein
MNVGALLWLLIFGVSAAVFFVIAAIVAVKGFRDLIELLHHHASTTPR